jgi:hypothetical protein
MAKLPDLFVEAKGPRFDIPPRKSLWHCKNASHKRKCMSAEWRSFHPRYPAAFATLPPFGCAVTHPPLSQCYGSLPLATTPASERAPCQFIHQMKRQPIALGITCLTASSSTPLTLINQAPLKCVGLAIRQKNFDVVVVLPPRCGAIQSGRPLAQGRVDVFDTRSPWETGDWLKPRPKRVEVTPFDPVSSRRHLLASGPYD